MMEDLIYFNTDHEQRLTTKERYQQAKNYEQGIGVEQDQIKAYKIYHQLAEEGCVLSQYLLGAAYLNNLLCECDLNPINFCKNSFIPKMIEQLKEEYVINNNYEAAEHLEKIYKANILNAKKLLMLAAEQQHADAIFALEEIYLNDIYGKQDCAIAKEYFKSTIKLQPDHILAKFRLGEIYTVENNISDALILYQESADAGCAASLYTLGIRYNDGAGVETNIALATSLIIKAAELGHAIAQYNLSMRYAIGLGVDKNEAKDVSWCLKSATGGYAEAQNVIGLRYASGQGLDLDYSKAIIWYKKAVVQDLADAQFNLAELYNSANAEAADILMAIHLYKKAALQDHLAAIYHLGCTYKSLANTVKKCTYLNDENDNIYLAKYYLEQAVLWYKKAAAKDHIGAKFDLGMMYFAGEIYALQQLEEAKQWLEEAATQNHKLAQHQLAEMYEKGCGVKQNTEMAYMWYKRANENNLFGTNSSYHKLLKKSIIITNNSLVISAASGTEAPKKNSNRHRRI